MIPLKLEFQAFGSYVSRQTVDFTKFSEGEIFLINGKTGSGKTTIIDAMVFALYGSGSGGDRNSLEKMRSYSFGAEKLPTQTEFTFSENGDVYKFSRECSVRIKKSRSGVLSEQVDTRCNAFRLENGVFKPLFENPKESGVTKLAEELIGLNKEQFTKVMVLPQGKFESFLLADSKDKEEILSNLFNVSMWKNVADWLCARAKEMGDEAEKYKLLSESTLSNEDCSDLEGLKEKISSEKVSEGELKKQVEEAENQDKKLQEELLEANRISEIFAKLSAAKKSLEKLSGEKEHYEKLREETEKNRIAAQIKPYYDECKARYKELSERGKELENAEKVLKSVQERKEALAEEVKKFAEQKSEIEGLKKLLEELSAGRPLFESLSVQNGKISLAKSEKIKISENVKGLEKAYIAVCDGFESCEKERGEIFEKMSASSDVYRQKTSVDSYLKLEKDAKKARLEAAEEQKTFDILNKNAEEALKEYETAKMLRDERYHTHVENLASSLAKGLSEGEPCPVCGSRHHEKLAESAGSTVTAEEIEALDKEVSRLSKLYDDARAKASESKSRLGATKEKLRDCEKELAECKSYDSSEIDEIYKKYESVVAASKLKDEVQSRYDKLKESKDASEKAFAEGKERLTKAESELETLEKVASEAKARISGNEKLSEFESLEKLNAKIAEISGKINDFNDCEKAASDRLGDCEKQEISASEAFDAAGREAHRAQENYNDRVEKYTEKMGELGLSGKEEFVPYLTENSEIQRKQKELDDFAAALKAAEVETSQLEKLTENLEKPDVAQISSLKAESGELVKKLIAQRATAEKEVKRLEKVLSDFEKIIENYEKVRKDFARLNVFAKDLRGDNGVGLRRYVLGVMLERVIAEANRILCEIKGGQFRLRVASEKQSGKRQFGLDLEVESTKTTKPYSVKNLSGGEKFLVALSLSMALSTIVQMFAGGVKIDALFIDEGFGTLDPSALDEAMQVLANMSGNRKVMGIISHVDALREAIQKKINVISDENGSHLVMVS